LIFTALITPYEVALLESAESWRDALFLINRFIDLIFLVDMAIQFNLMFELAGESMTQGSVWVTRPGPIASHYLRTWFGLDFMSVAISGLDFVTLYSDSDNLSSLKILRVLRVLRLVKLVRLLRASRILKRWEVLIAVDYGMLSLTMAVFTVIVIAHWLACVWVLQAELQDVAVAEFEPSRLPDDA
jgi:hypothetical protein